MIVPAPLRHVVLVGLCASAACGRDGGGGRTSGPPSVVSTAPADGTVASISTLVRATFSEEMDPATITGLSFVLTLATGGSPIAGTVAVADEVATFTPTAALSPETAYEATIDASAADLDGETLEAPYSWGFTTSSGEFVLSSTAFANGATIPDTYTCDGTHEQSPPLDWTPGPPGTQSYAIVFTDLDNALIHWVIWDIPASVTALATFVPNDALPNPPGGGAKQVRSYDGATFGYLGPCPAGALHTYEFVVYAVDVATLPNVTTGSTRDDVETEILLHDLDRASLQGTSDAG